MERHSGTKSTKMTFLTSKMRFLRSFWTHFRPPGPPWDPGSGPPILSPAFLGIPSSQILRSEAGDPEGVRGVEKGVKMTSKTAILAAKPWFWPIWRVRSVRPSILGWHFQNDEFWVLTFLCFRFSYFANFIFCAFSFSCFFSSPTSHYILSWNFHVFMTRGRGRTVKHGYGSLCA